MEQKIILVVEDSIPNRNITCQILKKLGFQTIEAVSGKDALVMIDLLEEHGAKIDGIVSDIMMPDMDGLGFLTNLRSIGSYDSIPFLFMTASTDREFVMKAKQLKVDGYLLKPLTFDKLQNKLQTLFPNHEFPNLKRRSA